MAITKLSIHGYRGFATKQSLSFAVPNGKRGSGLTVLVGANNAGKSSVVEALRLCAGGATPSFTEGRRNVAADGRVHIELAHDGNKAPAVIRTVDSGGAEAVREGDLLPESVLGLPSRRHFRPHFSKSPQERHDYVSNLQSTRDRGATLDPFAFRLFAIQKNRAAFDAVLAKVLPEVPNWVIEQQENFEYYLKFSALKGTHNSEGMGEGLVSLFVIIDALYDSSPEHVIVIDEPELSLHPSLQRRLCALLAEYARDRQIVLSTHSPYFVDPSTFGSGATVARVHLTEHGSCISQVSHTTLGSLAALATDANNPHVLGLDAREVFFLDDRIILVEGQEDVMHYGRVCEQAGVDLPGSFFGWGVGGASKMKLIADLLHECGFRRVAGLLDGDKPDELAELQAALPGFCFMAIPADDVRSKKAVKPRDAVIGLLDDEGTLRPEFAAQTSEVLRKLAEHLAGIGGAA